MNDSKKTEKFNEYDKYPEPLIPNTPSGISLVAILITVSLAMLGFIGQRALVLDEQVIALQEQQKDDNEIALVISEISIKLTEVEKRQENRRETISLVQNLDERINRAEVRIEDMLRELERMRNE